MLFIIRFFLDSSQFPAEHSAKVNARPWIRARFLSCASLFSVFFFFFHVLSRQSAFGTLERSYRNKKPFSRVCITCEGSVEPSINLRPFWSLLFFAPRSCICDASKTLSILFYVFFRNVCTAPRWIFLCLHLFLACARTIWNLTSDEYRHVDSSGANTCVNLSNELTRLLDVLVTSTPFFIQIFKIFFYYFHLKPCFQRTPKRTHFILTFLKAEVLITTRHVASVFEQIF